MLEKFETNFSIIVSTIVLAMLAAVVIARAANSADMIAVEPGVAMEIVG